MIQQDVFCQDRLGTNKQRTVEERNGRRCFFVPELSAAGPEIGEGAVGDMPVYL